VRKFLRRSSKPSWNAWLPSAGIPTNRPSLDTGLFTYIRQITACLAGCIMMGRTTGRRDVPYFICYYLAGPLHAVKLENIFTCLHKGPVALIDRHSISTTLEAIVVRNLWLSARPPWVAIALGVRRQSHCPQPAELLDLFRSANTRWYLSWQTYEQQKRYGTDSSGSHRESSPTYEKFGGRLE